MPRKTKAERERIKVTCLWCENIARTHFICGTCIKSVGAANAEQYKRDAELIEWRIGRRCGCGAAIPYEATLNTKNCTYCRTTRGQRRHQNKYPAKRRYGKRTVVSCSRCGINAPGKTYCAACYTKHREEVGVMRRKRICAGLCQECGTLPLATSIRCRPCAEKANKASAETRMIAIADGKCGRCRKRKHAPGHTLCKPCMETKREQNKRATL